MTGNDEIGVLLIDAPVLTLDELAFACGVHAAWVARQVDEECLSAVRDADGNLRFGSAELARCRRLAEVERIFEVNQQAAAFITDLIEEVGELRRRLRFTSSLR